MSLINLIKNLNINIGNPAKTAPKVFNFETLGNFFSGSNKKNNKDLIPYYFYNNITFTNVFWKTCFDYVKLKKEINSKKLILLIKRNFNKKNYFELITIYSILITLGKFSIAYKIRKLFFLILENDNPSLKSKYLNKIISLNKGIQSKEKKNLKKNKVKIINSIKNFKDKNFNKLLSKYLYGKKVSVVGVSIGSQGNAKKINKFDIVVKFNFFSKKYYSDLNTQSDRCDISYFSDYFLKNKKKLILNSKNQIKYFVFKFNKSNDYSLLPKKETAISNVYDDLILGTPSLLINTLFDLIRYYPSEIMIFNSTLYYPINNKIRNLNTKKYRKINFETKYSVFSIVKSFAVHDIITEYIIVRNLFILKLIKVDNQLERILNLGLEKYLRKMEKYYKNSILILLNKNYKGL